jgi:hypothetical protein
VELILGSSLREAVRPVVVLQSDKELIECYNKDKLGACRAKQKFRNKE